MKFLKYISVQQAGKIRIQRHRRSTLANRIACEDHRRRWAAFR